MSSISTIIARCVRNLQQVWQRFPVAVAFCAITAVCGIIINERALGNTSADLEFFMIAYPSIAAVIAVAMQLCREQRVLGGSHILVQAGAHAVWLALAVWMAWGMHAIEATAALLSIIVLVAAALLCLPHARRGNDLDMWSLASKLVVGGVVALVAATVMQLGEVLLCYLGEQLFGIGLPRKLPLDLVWVNFALVAPVVVLQFVPREPAGDAAGLPRLLAGIVHYLFMPLLGLYFVVLYVYGAKILLAFTLPNGMVAWLVTAMMAGMLAVLALTYPTRSDPASRADRWAWRWLPVLALPLLVLMSVGIGRRLADYGITVSRLYVLTFNVWCYGVCIYLIAKGHKARLSHVLASLAAVGVLTSVGPQSYANVVLRQFKAQVRAALGSQVKLPLTNDGYLAWQQSAKLLPDQREAIDSKIDYIWRNYNREDHYSDLFDEHFEFYWVRSTSANDDASRNLYARCAVKRIDVRGFDSLTEFSVGEQKVDSVTATSLTVTYPDYGSFVVPLAELERRDIQYDQENSCDVLLLDNGKCRIVVSRFVYYPIDRTFTVEGYALERSGQRAVSQKQQNN